MTTFSNDTVSLFMTRFEPVLKMALQQKTSLLRGKIDEMYVAGAKQVSPLNLIAPAQIPQRVGRYQPKNFSQASYVRRWVAPTDFEQDYLVDYYDLEKTTIDPKSGIVQAFAAAFGREIDDAIITAATGAAQIGTDAGSLTTESFTQAGAAYPNTTSNYQILGSFSGTSTTGLTVAKINEARRILEYNHNIEELMAGDAFLIIGPQQHADLRNQALVTSHEFNSRQGVLSDEGYVSQYLGFKIVVSNRLPTITDAAGNTTQRGCLAFVKSGLKLGMWQDLKTEVLRQPQLSGNPWDLNVMASYGVTRTELGKIVQICSYDISGADTTP